MLPHAPFYFDENGNEKPYLSLFNSKDKDAYLAYLKYSNKVLLNLVQEILTNSSKPPIIILASDHGYRALATPGKSDYLYMNICALYLPDKEYSQFYDGISLVNIFRALFNKQFKQKLPLLEDKTIYID